MTDAVQRAPLAGAQRAAASATDCCWRGCSRGQRTCWCDEPTNDLDIDTLELLEDLLQNYEGTVFLVSHDRRFSERVVTSTIAYEGIPKSLASGANTKAA